MFVAPVRGDHGQVWGNFQPADKQMPSEAPFNCLHVCITNIADLKKLERLLKANVT